MPTQPITISDLRGGRNGIDSPVDPLFPANQCCEAYNVDFSDGPLGRRRGGSDLFNPGGGTAFGTNISAMSRWVPAGDDTVAELHVVDGGAVPLVKRLTGGVFANVTLDHPIVATPHKIATASLNGKHVYAYDAGAAVDRLHLYDPDLAVPRIRVSGIAPGLVAPTVADTGAGAYVNTTRYYRVRFIQIAGTRVVRRSEPTPASLVFNPSGGGLAARVTRPAAPGEGETHWELDSSTNNKTWYKLSSFALGTHTAIATTTYDDTFATTSYSTLEAADISGMYTLLPSARYVVADGNRLIMAGRYASSLNTSRVWFTPVLGSGDQGDDERMLQTSTIKPFFDLNEKDGGEINGLSDPVSGIYLAFKYRRTWKATPTLDVNTPYAPREISHSIGSIDHDGIVVAEDAEGNASVYWLSHRGPYRYGSQGLQYLGRDIEDYWRGLKGKSKVNLDATTKVCHGKYYPDLRQIWWWVATGTSNTPNLIFVLDLNHATRVDRFGVRGGWAIHDGPRAAALCSVMFGDLTGAAVGKRLRPFVGLVATPTIYKCDTTRFDDVEVPFQAYITTKSVVPSSQLLSNFGVAESMLCAGAQDTTLIRQTLITNFGLDERYDEVSLAPDKDESYVIRGFNGSQQSEVQAIQIKLGDPGAVSVGQWSLVSLTIPVTDEGDA